MARLSAATLGFLALLFLTGCGSHGNAVIKTAAPVTGLALDGSRLAWTDCRRIHVVSGDHETTLRLPGRVRDRYCQGADNPTGGHLVLARNIVGWRFDSNSLHAGLYSVALGVTSSTTGATRFLAEDPGYDWKAAVGVEGTVAADNGTLLWTWPRVVLSGPEDAIHYCGDYTRQAKCKVAIGEAGIHGWRRGVIPAAAPIATDHGWLAAGVVKTGIFPQARSVGPRLVVVRRLRDGAPVAAVRTRGLVEGLALSHRLLAVQRLGAIDLYALPSGRFLRTVDVRFLWFDGGFLSPLAVRGGDLIVWGRGARGSGRIEKVDSATGERTILVHAPGLTAVTVDGSRLAWATTSGNGGVIRTRSLDSPARTQA